MRIGGGYDLPGELECLRCDFQGWVQGRSSDVASWASKAGHKAAKHWIGNTDHHDRCSRRCLFGGQGRRRPLGYQEVNFQTNKLEREVRKVFDAPWCIAALQSK